MATDAKPKQSPNIVVGITLLLAYQLFGEIVVLVFGLPFPGPVVGMLALFLTLALRGSWSKSLEQTSYGILRHLSLLFIPAGVGVMVHASRMGSEWLSITTALITSSLIGLVATGLVMQALSSRGKPVKEKVQNGN